PAPPPTKTDSPRHPTRSGHRARSVPSQDSSRRRSDIVSRLCGIRSRQWESGVDRPLRLPPDRAGSAAPRARYATVRPDASLTRPDYRTLDFLQAILFDPVDQVTILRQRLAPFHLERFILAESALRAA